MARGYSEAHRILHMISIENDLPVERFTNGLRTKTVAAIRRQAISELRKGTDLSWSEINALVGRSRNNKRE